MNTLQYAEVTQKLNKIQTLAENVEASLNDISNLINESVNTGAGVWDGESASQFMEKWKTLDADLPGFIEDFKKQARNISTILEKTQAVDTYE